MDEQQAERLAQLAAKGRAAMAGAASTSPSVAVSPPAAASVTAPMPAGRWLSPPDPTTFLAAAPLLPTAGLVNAAATAVAAGPAPTKRTTAPKGLPDGIEARPRSGRRKHVALAGRIMAAGLSTSTLFVGVASLAAAPAPSWEKKPNQAADAANAADAADAADEEAGATDPSVDPASLTGDYGYEDDETDATDTTAASNESIAAPVAQTTAAPVPETIVIVQKLPHYVYVDEAGNPIDDPSQATGAPAPVKAAPRKSGGGGSKSGGSNGGGGGAAQPAAEPTPQAAPPPAQAAPPPAQAAPPPPPQAPAQTAAPKPTAPPPPPPPKTTAPPPKCTGSQC